MRIDNGAKSVEQQSQTQQTQSAKSIGESHGPRDGSLTSIDVGSIDGLLQLIVSSTEIRQSMINELKTKIQTGEYLAKQSALQTASSILNL